MVAVSGGPASLASGIAPSSRRKSARVGCAAGRSIEPAGPGAHGSRRPCGADASGGVQGVFQHVRRCVQPAPCRVMPAAAKETARVRQRFGSGRNRPRRESVRVTYDPRQRVSYGPPACKSIFSVRPRSRPNSIARVPDVGNAVSLDDLPGPAKRRPRVAKAYISTSSTRRTAFRRQDRPTTIEAPARTFYPAEAYYIRILPDACIPTSPTSPSTTCPKVRQSQAPVRRTPISR